MARLNTLNLNLGPRTHEGAPARHISPELQLGRSALACLLWENQFYEDGVEIAGRIAELVPKVTAEKVAALAVDTQSHWSAGLHLAIFIFHRISCGFYGAAGVGDSAGSGDRHHFSVRWPQECWNIGKRDHRWGRA